MRSSLDTAILQKLPQPTTNGAKISYSESIYQTTATHGLVQSSAPSPIPAPANAIIVIGPQTINYNPNPTL